MYAISEGILACSKVYAVPRSTVAAQMSLLPADAVVISHAVAAPPALLQAASPAAVGTPTREDKEAAAYDVLFNGSMKSLQSDPDAAYFSNVLFRYMVRLTPAELDELAKGNLP